MSHNAPVRFATHALPAPPIVCRVRLPRAGGGSRVSEPGPHHRAEPPLTFARRLLADTGQAAFGRVLALVVWTLLVPFLLRRLGAQGFSLWALFFSLTGYLSALDLGFSQGTLRHVAAARARGDGREAGEFAMVGLCGYLVLGAAWFALTPLLREPALGLLRIEPGQRALAGAVFTLGPVAFTFMGTAMVTSAALQGWGRFDLANLVTVSSVLVQAGGALLALDRGWGLLGVVRFAVGGSLVGTCVGLLMLWRGARGFEMSTPRRAATRVREALAFGGPLQVGSVFGVAHQQLDKVLLTRYVALAFVTPYELGQRASTVLGSLPQMLLLALIPAASGMHALGDTAGIRAAYDRSSRWVMAITSALAAGLIAGAPRLLGAWLDTPPAGADLAVIGLTVAMMTAMSAGTGTAIARALGRTHLEAEYSALGFGTHVALGLWLVPRHGLPGALVATMVSGVLASGWFLFRFGRMTNWGFAAVFARPSLLPLGALALGVLVGQKLAHTLPNTTGLARWPWAVVAGAVPAVVVFAVLLLTRFLSIAEIRAVLRRGAPLKAPAA